MSIMFNDVNRSRLIWFKESGTRFHSIPWFSTTSQRDYGFQEARAFTGAVALTNGQRSGVDQVRLSLALCTNGVALEQA